MKIRTYAKSVGFAVIGKINYMGKWDFTNRWYMDEAGNAYLLDMSLGTIRIIERTKHRRSDL